jgi:23S rRNA pseudouridine1911/1915/1917 synthase
MARKDIPFEIIFENDDVVVVNKAAGTLSVPDRFDGERVCLSKLLEEKFGTIFVVHRLDRDTSGVMVFAKTEAAHRALSLAFENRAVQKEYLAVVSGDVREDEGVIELALSEDTRRAGKMRTDPEGKPATTRYKVEERFRRFTLLRLFPETGRTHQIRVHCAAKGFPLAIDPIYGSDKPILLSRLKRKYKLHEGTEEKPLISRLPLHAEKLHLRAIEGLTIDQTFEAPVPRDMHALLNQLRKNRG